MRVLIVEDQTLIALTLAQSLESAGHQIVGHAASSGEALELARLGLAELAFVDIDLERRGVGLQVARHLHSEFQVAVVMTTGQPDLGRSCSFALGLFTKPYDPDEVAASVVALEAILAGKSPVPHSIPTTFELFTSANQTKRLEATKPPLRSVLLVEDHPQDVELAIAALGKCRVANPIAIARDGVEALDYLGANSFQGAAKSAPPALVLLDIKMPRINGLEVLQYIKKHSELQTIPVVMLSASSQEADLRHCELHGAAAFITKTHSFDEFVGALSGLDRFLTLH